jgi:hypothetical protein
MKELQVKWGLYTVFLLICLTSSINSQQWSNSSELTGDDRVNAMTIDRQGNIYITVYATRTSSGVDFCTRKYNPSGVLQWTVFYNGPGNGEDRAWGIVVDNIGNIIVTGHSVGVNSLSDYTTIKYNSNGVQQWIQRYDTPVNGDDRAFGIAVDRLNTISVTGYITQIGTGTDIYTVKYKAIDGQPIWGQTIINPVINSEDRAFGIAVDSLGNNVYICGYTQNGAGQLGNPAGTTGMSGQISGWIRGFGAGISAKTSSICGGFGISGTGIVRISASRRDARLRVAR